MFGRFMTYWCGGTFAEWRGPELSRQLTRLPCWNMYIYIRKRAEHKLYYSCGQTVRLSAGSGQLGIPFNLFPCRMKRKWFSCSWGHFVAKICYFKLCGAARTLWVSFLSPCFWIQTKPLSKIINSPIQSYTGNLWKYLWPPLCLSRS